MDQNELDCEVGMKQFFIIIILHGYVKTAPSHPGQQLDNTMGMLIKALTNEFWSAIIFSYLTMWFIRSIAQKILGAPDDQSAFVHQPTH